MTKRIVEDGKRGRADGRGARRSLLTFPMAHCPGPGLFTLKHGAIMDELLCNYPVVIDIPIAWGEMDALQHVNNIVYFRYFESVRVAYLEKIDFIALEDTACIGPILAATRCRYRIPLTYPDTIRVGARVDRVETDRFFMKYAVVSQKHGKVVAEGEAEIVAYDYRALVKTAIPEVVAARIADVESE